ncbi:MAG: hypothetical protein ABW136_10485 [Steroidobacteraceae bacterium]
MTRGLLLAALGVLCGCSTERLVRDNVVPECPGHADRAVSRAASCMAAAFYDIAREDAEDRP